MARKAMIHYPVNPLALLGRQVIDQDGNEGVITYIDNARMPIHVDFANGISGRYYADGYVRKGDDLYYITLLGNYCSESKSVPSLPMPQEKLKELVDWLRTASGMTKIQAMMQ
jgi:hypothetical protein